MSGRNCYRLSAIGLLIFGSVGCDGASGEPETLPSTGDYLQIGGSTLVLPVDPSHQVWLELNVPIRSLDACADDLRPLLLSAAKIDKYRLLVIGHCRDLADSYVSSEFSHTSPAQSDLILPLMMAVLARCDETLRLSVDSMVPSDQQSSIQETVAAIDALKTWFDGLE